MFAKLDRDFIGRHKGRGRGKGHRRGKNWHPSWWQNSSDQIDTFQNSNKIDTFQSKNETCAFKSSKYCNYYGKNNHNEEE